MEIIADNIQKKYGKHRVLTGVSFKVTEGTCVGITGRNGCGKTTLLSILAGTEKADSGSVTFTGGKKGTGYLPQVNPLLEKLSVEDNLKVWAKNRENLENALIKYDLADIRKKTVYKLSGGMKRRCAIACALVNDPGLLIMDEPTAALDIEYKKLIHDEMRRYTQDGGTIIMVTHEKEEMDMCDRCFILENGTVT